MKQIYLVTSNKGKVESAKKYLSKNVELFCLDANLEEPNINNIDYIAEQKVKQAYQIVKKPCISLDAGFYIPNYPNNPNFPGAFPKRELIDKIGIDGLLENMKDVKDRECYFKECLAYFDGNQIYKFYGKCEGVLTQQKLGENREQKWSDLWYVFIPKNCDKTLAQMSDEERAERPDGHTNAFYEFAKWLGENYD